MPDHSIIPRDIHGMTAYQHSTDNRFREVILPTNWERFDITLEEKDEWHNFRIARDLIIVDLENPLTHTTEKEGELHDNGIDFIDFATPIINRMRVNTVATSADASVFHFTIGRADPTHQILPIEVGALGHSHSLGGGMMKIPCNIAGSSCHIPHELGADAVEIRYVIGDRIPTGPLDGTEQFVSKRSRVIIPLDPANRGKKFRHYKRWVNLSFPALNGPWSSGEDDIIL